MSWIFETWRDRLFPCQSQKILFYQLESHLIECLICQKWLISHLFLKQKKTDINHTEVQIIVLAIIKLTCPIAALCCLFNLVKQLAFAPLFILFNTVFSQVLDIFILKSRLAQAGLFKIRVSIHGFRKNSIQYAFNKKMLESQIQKLSFWIWNLF